MLEIIIVSIYVIILILILIYCLLELGLAIHYLKSKRKERTKQLFPASLPPEEYPFVTVQLPVFNEMYVVERLIDKVVEFDYPKERYEIQVLDDSTDETVEISQKKVEEYKAQGFDISLHHRVDRKGFKAGALQEALKVCKGEFIAIFDADFLPAKDFLKNTIPYFADERLGVVQTRWSHINKNYSLLTRVQAFFLDAHFTVEQAGRNSQGYFINFNGTAGVWRKATIEDAGGWQADTLTEDLDLSYRAQMKDWLFLYLEEFLSPAELPADMKSFKSQQFRWIKGGAETARKLLPTIFKSDLPFSIKLNAFSHLLSSSVYIMVFLLVLLSIPLLLVKNTYIEAEYIHYGAPFFISNIAMAVVYYASNKENFKKVSGIVEYLFMMPTFLLITMGLSLHNAVAALRGLARERTPFIRTPKFNITTKKDGWKNNKYTSRKIDFITMLEGALSGYFLFGIIYGISIGDVSLLPIHAMAFVGFFSVFAYSVKHSIAPQ